MIARGVVAMMLSFVFAAALAGRARAAKPAAGAGAGKKKTGVPTVSLPSPGNPLVALRVYFRTGAVDDPQGKEGLAALTAAMLGHGGTKAHSYAEVLDALYPLAAHIGVSGDKESVVLSGTVHRDNLLAFADLLAAQVLTPRFADEDFTRTRQDALDSVEKTLRGNDDENLGKQALASVMYKGQAYGRPTQGTVHGLKAVTLDDVKAFYGTHFTRDRLIVGVAGGYPDGFAEAFAARFEALPAKGAPVPKLPKPPTRKGLEVLLVEKDARANAISIGMPIAVTRRDDDFYPLFLAASYLGEHRTFNGVLMNHMRGERGLNYGDYAYVENFIQESWSTFPLPNIARRQQHFEIWIRPVPPHNAGFALRAALYETGKLIKDGIPQAAFEATRDFLLSYSSLWTQSASRRLGYAIDAAVYGRDLQAELKARLPKMTKADVDKAVRKHLRADALAVAIVTDKASELADKLASGAATPITYDTKGTPQAILDEDKVIEALPLKLAGKPAIIKVDALFEK